MSPRHGRGFSSASAVPVNGDRKIGDRNMPDSNIRERIG
jgi:hypothetical protein